MVCSSRPGSSNLASGARFPRLVYKKDFFGSFPNIQNRPCATNKPPTNYWNQHFPTAYRRRCFPMSRFGRFLSGGIDSPLVCHYAARNSTRPLKTFTIGSDSIVHDETHLANAYSDLIGTQHYLSTMQADPAIELFDDAMACLREPIADLSIIPTHLVSRLARAACDGGPFGGRRR